jgi:hypothetical protein
MVKTLRSVLTSVSFLVCAVCAVVSWESLLEFAGSEFGNGTLAVNQGLVCFLFVFATVLIFLVSADGIRASLDCRLLFIAVVLVPHLS